MHTHTHFRARTNTWPETDQKLEWFRPLSGRAKNGLFGPFGPQVERPPGRPRPCSRPHPSLHSPQAPARDPEVPTATQGKFRFHFLSQVCPVCNGSRVTSSRKVPDAAWPRTSSFGPKVFITKSVSVNSRKLTSVSVTFTCTVLISWVLVKILENREGEEIKAV